MIFFKTWHRFLCDFPRPAHVCRQIQWLPNFRLQLVEEQNTHYSPPPRLLRAIHHYSTQIADILTLVASSVSDDTIARFGQVSVKLFRHLETVFGQMASDYSVREMLGQVTVFKDAVDHVNSFRSECPIRPNRRTRPEMFRRNVPLPLVCRVHPHQRQDVAVLSSIYSPDGGLHALDVTTQHAGKSAF
jgi:hypothetical protein